MIAIICAVADLTSRGCGIGVFINIPGDHSTCEKHTADRGPVFKTLVTEARTYLELLTLFFVTHTQGGGGCHS